MGKRLTTVSGLLGLLGSSLCEQIFPTAHENTQYKRIRRFERRPPPPRGKAN